jgi:hypothetical protein
MFIVLEHLFVIVCHNIDLHLFLFSTIPLNTTALSLWNHLVVANTSHCFTRYENCLLLLSSDWTVLPLLQSWLQSYRSCISRIVQVHMWETKLTECQQVPRRAGNVKHSMSIRAHMRCNSTSPHTQSIQHYFVMKADHPGCTLDTAWVCAGSLPIIFVLGWCWVL